MRFRLLKPRVWKTVLLAGVLAVAALATAGAASKRPTGPKITSISPDEGPVSGGTLVVIQGSHFKKPVSIRFDTSPSEGTTFISSDELIAVTPAHAAGKVSVSLAHGDGHAHTSISSFTYREHIPFYTLTHQQPVNFQFNPGSIFTQALPADVGRHLAVNSQAIVQTIFGGTERDAYVTAIREDPADFGGMPFYYSDASDPVYKVVEVSGHPCGRGRSCDFSPVGKYFHLKPGARMNGSGGDQSFVDWDQSQELDKKGRQRVLDLYNFNFGRGNVTDPGCRARTPAEADRAGKVCQTAAVRWGSLGYPLDDHVAYGETGGAWASPGVGPPAGFLRWQELQSGQIGHALWVNTWCVKTPPAFPGEASPRSCASLREEERNRPAAGQLFWIDGGYDCQALPAWQEGVCRAMQTYGAYVSDTGGSYSTEGLWITKQEGPTAYQQAGVKASFWDWLLAQAPHCGGGVCEDQPKAAGLTVTQDKSRATLRFFNMPGVLPHLHVVDPCIPRRMAGRPGAC